VISSYSDFGKREAEGGFCCPKIALSPPNRPNEAEDGGDKQIFIVLKNSRLANFGMIFSKKMLK